MRRPVRRTLGGPFGVLTIAIMLIIGSDNGFRVLLLNQLGYDPTNNVCYLNNLPQLTTTSTVATATHGATTIAAAG